VELGVDHTNWLLTNPFPLPHCLHSVLMMPSQKVNNSSVLLYLLLPNASNKPILHAIS